MKMLKYLSFCAFLLIGFLRADAQATLPEITLTKEGSINILSWINPYKSGIKMINVERSKDSIVNFISIGQVQDLNNAVQKFVDGQALPGVNYYKVVITFTSNIQWISNTVSIGVDSADVLNRGGLPSNDSLQKLLVNTNGQSISNVKSFTYEKSKFVFTNPFTGHINIELSDYQQSKYQLVFYNQQDEEVINIPRINDKVVVLDKRNFQKPGLYKFKLLKDNKVFEEGLVSIY